MGWEGVPDSAMRPFDRMEIDDTPFRGRPIVFLGFKIPWERLKSSWCTSSMAPPHKTEAMTRESKRDEYFFDYYRIVDNIIWGPWWELLTLVVYLNERPTHVATCMSVRVKKKREQEPVLIAGQHDRNRIYFNEFNLHTHSTSSTRTFRFLSFEGTQNLGVRKGISLANKYFRATHVPYLHDFCFFSWTCDECLVRCYWRQFCYGSKRKIYSQERALPTSAWQKLLQFVQTSLWTFTSSRFHNLTQPSRP